MRCLAKLALALSVAAAGGAAWPAARLYDPVVAARLRALDFAALDEQADALRASGERTEDGRWRLSVLYAAIEETLPYLVDDDGLRAAIEAGAVAYASAHPASANAGLFVACVLEAEAWAARGRGWEDAVPADAAREFARLMGRARDALEQGRVAMRANPQWYADRAALALVTREPAPVREAIVRDGLALAPGYHRLYYVELQARAPRWGGDRQAMAEWIAAAGGGSPAYAAEGLDARLAWAGEDEAPGLLDEPALAWPRVRDAIESLVIRWPSQHNVQAGFLMACRRMDRATAAWLEVRVREPLRQDAVDRAQQPAFRRCRAWAAHRTDDFAWRDPAPAGPVLVR